MYKIDKSQGNGNEEDFIKDDVYWRLLSVLNEMEIGPEARTF